MRLDMSITEKSQVKFDLSIAELHDFFNLFTFDIKNWLPGFLGISYSLMS